VKQLRAKLIELEQEGKGQGVAKALGDVHLALQLFAYPGDYVASSPTDEHVVETLEKFEEDLDDVPSRPLVGRRATLVFGEGISARRSLRGCGRGRRRRG
jgi:hypothetical protein